MNVEEIKKIRIDRDCPLTQKEFAYELTILARSIYKEAPKVSIWSIRAWEQGTRNPDTWSKYILSIYIVKRED